MKNDQGQRPDADASRGAVGPDPVGHLFEQARRDGFTRAETEKLWRGIIVGGAASGDPSRVPLGTTIPGAVAPGIGIKVGTVLMIGVGVAAGLGALGTLLTSTARSHEQDAREGSARAPAAMATAVEAPRADPFPPLVAWEDLPRARAPGVDPGGSMRRSRARGEPTGLAAPASEPPVRGSEVPSTIEAVEPMSAPAAPSPEGALLLRARRELASNPATALELTGEDGRRFPDGALTPEREVLAIEALKRLGRLPEARARLAALHARYPQSPHLKRLDALLGHQ
jgi:hypothetical protein